MHQPGDKHRAPLLVGVAISLALHVGVLVPMLVAVMTARSEAAPDLESDFDADSVIQPAPIEPEIELGKDESKHSTLSWIGYDEYQQHIAALSEVEQAAFDERPFGAMPTNPAPPSEQVPQQPTQDAQPSPTSDVAATEAQTNPLVDPGEFELELDRETPSVEPTITAPLDAADAQPTPLPADETVTPEQPAGMNAAPRAVGNQPSLESIAAFIEQMLSTAQQAAEELANSQTTGQSDEHASPTEGAASASASAPKRAEETTEEEAAKANAPTPRVTASQPAPQTDKPGEQRDADQSEQEADATSTIAYDDLKVGKPLVSKGLELKPRKPTFTQLVRMTALPANPLCEIRFQSNGKPALARLLSSSGDSRVDDAVLASLYRWRASGEQLKSLSDGETIDIQIRIIFNAR